MAIDISLHTSRSGFRVERFLPWNSMGLVVQSGSDRLTVYDIPADRAWAMFDLFRDDETLLNVCDGSLSLSRSADPDRFDAEMAKCRAQYFPQPEVAA